METAVSIFEKLEQLTKRVPAYNPWYFNESRIKQLVCTAGSAYSAGVYADRNISIAKTTFEENSALGKHMHPEKEVIHVLEGELTVVLIENRKPRTIVLKQYDSLEIMPQVHHLCANTIKTIIIAITMPYSKYFPKPYEKPIE